MKLVFAVLAQSVSIDQISNRLSLFNVVEGIQVQQFPIVFGELSFAASLRREDTDPNKFDSTLTVRLGETTIGQASIAVDFGDKPNTRLIANFQGLPIPVAGTLEFSLSIPNGEPVKVSVEAFQGPASTQ